MAEKEINNSNKLGHSTSVKIGGRQYSTKSIPKTTANPTHSDEKATTMSSGKKKNFTATTGSSNSETTGTMGSGGTTINTSKIKTSTETKQQIKNVKRQSSVSVTSQTIVSKTNGYQINNSINTNASEKKKNFYTGSSGSDTSSTGRSVNTAKTKVNITPGVKTIVETEEQSKKNIQRQSSISVKSQTIISKPKIQSAYQINNIKNFGTSKNVVGKVKKLVRNEFEKQDDSGTKTLATAITTGDVSVKVFKTAQDVSPYIVKGAVGAYYVGKKTVKVVHRIDSTIGKIKTGVIKLDKDTATRLKNIVFKGAKKTGTAVVKTGIKGIKTGTRSVGYSIKTGVVVGVKTGVNVLANSDDAALQTVGNGIKLSKYAIKGIATTPKAAKSVYRGVKTGVNTAIKTGKFTARTVRGAKDAVVLAKKIGAKNVLKYYRQRWAKSLKGKAIKALRKAGNSVVTLAIEVVKKLGMKVVVPLILIVVVIACITNLISSVSVGVGSIFSPFLSDENGYEIDETGWLTSQITTRRNDFIQSIHDVYSQSLVANGGEYHSVRFFNAFTGTEMELTDTNINTSIYSVEQYLQYIQPVFHTIMMSEYNMQPTGNEMQAVFDELWAKLTVVQGKALPVEYCNMIKTDNSDGTYTITPVTKGDGDVHAITSTCPNYSTTKYHGSNYYGSCCYYYSYMDGEGNVFVEKNCRGYHACLGHNILSLTILLGSFDDLLNNYYLDEINQLKGKSSLTVDEQKRLQYLTDYYEICINYLEVLQDEMGFGNGVVVDLSGVTLTEITNYACQFVGNPYVWGGTDPNTGADCSGFVQYVYAHFGVSLPRVSSDQVRVGTIVSSISEAQPGDLIFYSDNGRDDGVYHVAMYLGGGKLVHASNSKPYPEGGIKIGNVYGPIYKIKRIAHE